MLLCPSPYSASDGNALQKFIKRVNQSFTVIHKAEDKLKNRHNIQTKHNPGRANNAKHNKTKLAWFSRFLRHSARNLGGLKVD